MVVTISHQGYIKRFKRGCEQVLRSRDVESRVSTPLVSKTYTPFTRLRVIEVDPDTAAEITPPPEIEIPFPAFAVTSFGW